MPALNIQSPIQRTEFNGAVSYVFLNRKWFPYGSDLVLYQMNAARECRNYVEASGELVVSRPPRVIRDQIMATEKYLSLLKRVAELSVMKLPEEFKRRGTANCDDSYGVLLPSGERKSAFVPGSWSSDERIIAFREILTAPDLCEFYRSEREKRRVSSNN